MRKIKIWTMLAMAFAICLLTACGGQAAKQSPDISSAFDNESKPRPSANVVSAMIRYETAIDEYCKFMNDWFKLDVLEQAEYIDEYTAFNDELARNQDIMSQLLDREDEFTETDYEYIQQTALRCSQKLLNCASGGLEAAEEALNGEGSDS